jgi:hypothetical protein
MSKFYLDSLGMRGAITGIIGALPTFGRLFGLEITDEEVNAISQGVEAVLLAAGSVMVIVGRWRATQPLRLKRKG